MKQKVIDLQRKIKNNIDYISTQYSTIDDILYQLTLILDMKMTNDKIEQWFELNSSIVNTIENILERQSDI